MQKYSGFIQELIFLSGMPLQCLLATVDSQEPHENDKKPIQASFPGLKYLFMNTNCTLSDIAAWLLHCPRLETLALSNVKSLPKTDTDTGETILAKDRGVHLLQYCQRLMWLDINNLSEDGFLLQPWPVLV